MVSSTPCGAAVVVVMVSSTPCGVTVVVVVLSTPRGVAVVYSHYSRFIHPLWCGCGAGNGGGNGYKASLSCRSFGCQAYLNIIQGLRFRVQGDPKMRVVDGKICATSPHPLKH